MKGREVCLLVVVALLTACANGPGALPDSGGKPFEVLVVDDSDSLVTRSLQVTRRDCRNVSPLLMSPG